MSPSSTVYVNIVVENANGQNAHVVLKDFIHAGEMIPERIGVLAAEAAGMAYTRLSTINDANTPCVRDRTGTLVPRTVVGP